MKRSDDLGHSAQIQTNTLGVVLDTNVLVSALAVGGKPSIILDMVLRGEITSFISERLIDELKRVLGRKFNFTAAQLHNNEEIVRDIFIVIAPKNIPNVVTRDPDDNHVLAICNEVIVDAVVSGDRDLLTLGTYKNVPIVTPDGFLKRFG